MKNENGFTFLECMIVVAILGIFLVIFSSVFLNNRGQTEKRATNAAEKFIEKNSIDVKRFTCAGDSNGNGYGSCNILTKGGEKIFLECPTSYFSVEWFGATGCKEVYQNFNFGMQGQ